VWEDVLKEVDSDGNGKIDLGEFIELMLKTF
jgi:Ca2+-binding EF-hand superfamily protein